MLRLRSGVRRSGPSLWEADGWRPFQTSRVAADDCQDAREAHLAAHLQHVVDMNRPEKVGDRDQVAHHPLFSVCGARRETRNLQPVRTSEDNP